MGLEQYKDKRSFSKTPEPTGGKSRDSKLIFVVQKHKASHLHYDFRLELRGVLKSWAVPKGPSLRPDEKRLAQLVEDHPFDYKNFEGIIPAGNYGAGTVIIWDQGTYTPADSKGNKNEDEKILIKQFYSGKISIVLKGKKLKGAFTLVKTPVRGEKAWLLFKVKDKHASEENIAEQDASVISGLTIEEMSGNPDAARWKSSRAAREKKQDRRKEHKREYKKEIKNPHHSRTTSPEEKEQIAIWQRLQQQEVQVTETIKVEGRSITLINYEQEYWPGITKLHLILYYQSIAQFILPHLVNRPLGLNVVSRWAGEKEASFVRNMKGHYPKWVKTFTTHRKHAVHGKSEDIDWVVCNDLSTLMYLLNLGVIDLHPWSARIRNVTHPDFIVIDLDPDDADEKDRSANNRNFKGHPDSACCKTIF